MNGETIKKIDTWIENQKKMIKIEREEEEEQMKQLLKETPVNDLIEFGYCIPKIKVKSIKVGPFDKPVATFTQKAFENYKKLEDCQDRSLLEKLKFTNNQRFSRGDLVSLFIYDKNKEFYHDKPVGVGSIDKLEDFKMSIKRNEKSS